MAKEKEMPNQSDEAAGKTQAGETPKTIRINIGGKEVEVTIDKNGRIVMPAEVQQIMAAGVAVLNQAAGAAAKQIADETTLNPKEAEMALEQLLKVLAANLLNSNSVQLGDWGSFSLTCSGVPSGTREEVTAGSISGLSIRFTPGKALKDILAGAVFKPAEGLVSKSK